MEKATDDQPLLSIIVVSFNTIEETLACLKSVQEQVRANHEVIVFDNASADGSAEAIAQQFPQLKLIKSDQNVGFARANNIAAEQARGRYLLLLNPDTVILDGAVDKLLAFARSHPEATIYGGRTVFADGTLNRYSCHNRPTPWSLVSMGLGLSALFPNSTLFNPEGLCRWNRDSIREVDCVSGCFLLLTRDMWMKLDGFDTSFFMYGEDTDLCMRAGAFGPCLIFPDATIIHHGGRSEKVQSDKFVRLFAAKRQLFEKHWTPALVPLGGLMLFSWALTRGLAHTMAGVISGKSQTVRNEWFAVARRWREYAVRRPG